MVKYCECCGRKVEIAFGSSKFCKKCSLYIFELKKENHDLKRRMKKKDKRIKELQAKILLKNDSSMY